MTTGASNDYEGIVALFPGRLVVMVVADVADVAVVVTTTSS